MAFIYNADIFCDSCGKAIKASRKKQLLAGDGGKTGLTEEEFDAVYGDERNYDSDEYPKSADDDDATDCPQHCGSHENCLEAEVLPSGTKIGKLIGTNLTSDGIEYVKEQVAEGGEVADFWREQFDYIDFPKNVNNPSDYDDFLDDATHAVHDMWVERGGKKLDTDDLYALNDVLTEFFKDKSPL